MKLLGKRAVVTGASQGLGLSIASAFAKEGAKVLICARGSRDVARAVDELHTQTQAEIWGETADVSIEADVERLARKAQDVLGGVDVLVCNAGVYGPKGSIDQADWADWVKAVQINLLGTVFCCRTFLPLLRNSARGKVLLLSGGGATKPLPNLSAYAASKAAVVRFGETLSEELRSDGIDVNSVAPGALNTRMLQEVIDAGPEKVGEEFYRASMRQLSGGGTPLEVGADLCVYLASDESDGISGKLISAVWDPWQEFGSHQEDLRQTDIYTLRRIVPSERNLGWK